MTNYTHQALKNYEPPIFYHTYIQYKEQKSYFNIYEHILSRICPIQGIKSYFNI
jgi:hypothetical protein